MLRKVKACKVCKTITRQAAKGPSRLQQAIYESYGKGGTSIQSIHRDYADKFSVQSLYNHARTHQALTADDLSNASIAKVAREHQDKTIATLIKHTDLRQAIIDEAHKMLQDGELKGWTVNAALKAAKDASDIEEKHMDRGMQLMDMVWAFASDDRVKGVIDGTVVGSGASGLPAGTGEDTAQGQV